MEEKTKEGEGKKERSIKKTNERKEQKKINGIKEQRNEQVNGIR